jgi:hypothetical protein
MSEIFANFRTPEEKYLDDVADAHDLGNCDRYEHCWVCKNLEEAGKESSGG